MWSACEELGANQRHRLAGDCGGAARFFHDVEIAAPFPIEPDRRRVKRRSRPENSEGDLGEHVVRSASEAARGLGGGDRGALPKSCCWSMPCSLSVSITEIAIAVSCQGSEEARTTAATTPRSHSSPAGRLIVERGDNEAPLAVACAAYRRIAGGAERAPLTPWQHTTTAELRTRADD